MKISKLAQRDARQLFRSCLVNGVLDEDRVRQAVRFGAGAKAARLHRNFVALAAAGETGFGTPTARVESATPLPPICRRTWQGEIRKIYGAGMNITFVQNPALIGGLRIQVGSDLYDGSVQPRQALANNFSKAKPE